MNSDALHSAPEQVCSQPLQLKPTRGGYQAACWLRIGTSL